MVCDIARLLFPRGGGRWRRAPSAKAGVGGLPGPRPHWGVLANPPQEKREWEAELVGEDVCIFEDIQQMGQDTAKCWQHGKRCPVQGVDLLIVGTSCKDISRASTGGPATSSEGPVFNREHSRGGSAQTYRGLMAYVRRHRPLLIIFENVDALDDACGGDGCPTNMDVICAEMSALGYDMQKLLTDASSFGLPQRRRTARERCR